MRREDVDKMLELVRDEHLAGALQPPRRRPAARKLGTLAACLAASCGDLMETVLLRAGLVSFPAAVGGLCFGLLLYLAALQAMGAGSKGGGLPP